MFIDSILVATAIHSGQSRSRAPALWTQPAHISGHVVFVVVDVIVAMIRLRTRNYKLMIYTRFKRKDKSKDENIHSGKTRRKQNSHGQRDILPDWQWRYAGCRVMMWVADARAGAGDFESVMTGHCRVQRWCLLCLLCLGRQRACHVNRARLASLTTFAATIMAWRVHDDDDRQLVWLPCKITYTASMAWWDRERRRGRASAFALLTCTRPPSIYDLPRFVCSDVA